MMTLKAARITAKMSVQQVANTLKVHKNTIYNWEKGTQEIPAKKYLELCHLYGQPIDNIFLP